MKRRTFFMLAGGLAGGLAVSGCSGESGTPAPGGAAGGGSGSLSLDPPMGRLAELAS